MPPILSVGKPSAQLLPANRPVASRLTSREERGCLPLRLLPRHCPVLINAVLIARNRRRAELDDRHPQTLRKPRPTSDQIGEVLRLGRRRGTAVRTAGRSLGRSSKPLLHNDLRIRPTASQAECRGFESRLPLPVCMKSARLFGHKARSTSASRLRARPRLAVEKRPPRLTAEAAK